MGDSSRTGNSSRTALSRFRRLYGRSPLHLLLLLGCFALAGYTVLELGPLQLLNFNVWWQSIGVWFIGSVLVVDLVLLPASAALDKSLQGVVGVRKRGRGKPRSTILALNCLRVPVLASGLLFLLFFPGIIGQGAGSYLSATGQTQDPFLQRWLLLTGAFFILSALVYVLGSARMRPEAKANWKGDY